MIPRRNVTAFPRILRTLVSGTPVAGARARLEEVLAGEWGFRAVRAMPSGRAALAWLLRAVRARTSPVAYVPALTIEAIPAIARACGYRVEFLDVDADTLEVTPEVLRRAHRGPGVAIVTHYFGLPADMPAVIEAADALGITVVEDCAHAPGARVRGRVVGSFGAGGIFSFETRKPLNALGGGLVASTDAAVVEHMAAMERPPMSRRNDARKLVTAALEWAALRPACLRLLAPALHAEGSRRLLVSVYRGLHSAGRDARHAFSDFQASLVLDQLRGLDGGIARRRLVAEVYDRDLPPEAVRPASPPSRPHEYYMYVIRHPRARELGRHLRRHGVDCGIGPEVLPLCAPPEVAPSSAAVASTAVELPMHDEMTPETAARVCEVARGFHP